MEFNFVQRGGGGGLAGGYSLRGRVKVSLKDCLRLIYGFFLSIRHENDAFFECRRYGRMEGCRGDDRSPRYITGVSSLRGSNRSHPLLANRRAGGGGGGLN